MNQALETFKVRGNKMNQALETLDKSMKNLNLELMKYREDDPHYQQTLSALAQQYQACKTLMTLAQDGINNLYFFKYSDIGGIENLLTNAGYLKQSSKANKR